MSGQGTNYKTSITIHDASTMSMLKHQLRLQQATFINIFHCFSEKIRLAVSSESSAGQGIHLTNQSLFSSKDKSEIKMSSAAIFVWRFKENLCWVTKYVFMEKYG